MISLLHSEALWGPTLSQSTSKLLATPLAAPHWAGADPWWEGEDPWQDRQPPTPDSCRVFGPGGFPLEGGSYLDSVARGLAAEQAEDKAKDLYSDVSPAPVAQTELDSTSNTERFSLATPRGGMAAEAMSETDKLNHECALDASVEEGTVAAIALAVQAARGAGMDRRNKKLRRAEDRQREIEDAEMDLVGSEEEAGTAARPGEPSSKRRTGTPRLSDVPTAARGSRQVGPGSAAAVGPAQAAAVVGVSAAAVGPVQAAAVVGVGSAQAAGSVVGGAPPVGPGVGVPSSSAGGQVYQ